MEDVLVVGGGPVGLLLAGELCLGGAKPLVLEGTEGAERRTRSFGQRSVNGRSAQTLSLRGLIPALEATQSAWIDHLEKAGQRTSEGDQISKVLQLMRDGRAGGHFGGLPLAANSADGRCYLMKQHMLENVLAEWAAGLGVRVVANARVTAVRNEEISAVAELADGRSMRASYIVGCDGGRSVVRKSAGFSFPGTPPTMTGRVAMADLSDDDRPTAVLRGPNGLVNSLMVPGEVTTVEFDGTGPVDRDAPMSAAELQDSMLRAGGLSVTVNKLHAGTRFSDNTRQADTYRRGRVLLAGDAAHVHSPIGGQGLNLGLQDAANLGWKLASVVTGRGPESLLDTYTAERHPAAARVLRSTRGQIALMRPGPQVDALREILAEVLAIPDAHEYFGGLVSGADLDYAPDSAHPLVGRFVPSELLNMAAEHMTDGRFLLIDSVGGERLSDMVAGNDRVRVVHQDRPESEVTALLVRPDGYVAWIGSDANSAGLPEALHQWCGQPLAGI
ncbi:FAD-dependent monooxygenase [Mycolicibacterium komossense]|uniref:FAD-dependent monooxygenase n=1 Tax=Mycolicibacterium komossense TaxID=1779 RepID=A0ABT3C6N5_9MYCO|nr:FAD-dependent monooxygenase [Mycolicibacterium komossense]MCV7225148.1 FAD-dependent monooxygenase [Mycolicibacterium komossense]